MIDYARIECPYCGEAFEARVDLSAGDIRYIEDCQVCCRPIELSLTLGDPEDDNFEDEFEEPDALPPDELMSHRPTFTLQARREAD